ncbi:MAG: c-type cytochrome [Acidobacteriaceae bacterium]|nr:c-type cytochrome [Acidobacteriaceae bacterium]
MTTHKTITKAGVSTFAFFLVACSLRGEMQWDAPRIVTTNCSGCHRVDGNSQLPYFPRVAGLNAAYSEKKLAEFAESPTPPVDELLHMITSRIDGHKSVGNNTPNERINMLGMAHAVKPEVLKEAVDWYARQTPAPGRGGNTALIQQGEQIFAKGVPDQHIIACMSCHGQSAQGQATAPRLAGQNSEYLEAQLVKFRRGDRKHAPEMTMEVRELNSDQARAVAAYLQSR